MNTEPTPISDEDLSAALDGEADAELIARIAADPEATARSAVLTSAAARVTGAAVPPLDADVVDDLVMAALDAPVAPAAPRHAGARRGPAPWLVAACIALLMAVGLALVWSGRNSDTDQADDTASSLATEAADSSGDQSAEFSDDPNAFSGAPTTTMALPSHTGDTATTTTSSSTEAQADNTARDPDAAPIPLGSFTSGDDLRTALASEFPTTATSASGADLPQPDAALLTRCAEQLQVTLNLADPPRNEGYATVDDQAVLVYEFDSTSFEDGSPTTLVAAVGEDSCEQVILFER